VLRSIEFGLQHFSIVRDIAPGEAVYIETDGTLYSSVLNTTPFYRHHFADVMEAMDMIKARDYPARGNV